MFNLIVCIKQVPMVSELPWDSKTGTLKRELAQGMMDPASGYALEAALQLKAFLLAQDSPVQLTALTMGPPMAEEILHQSIAMGADQGVLLTDRCMAGADTFLTSHVLARFIRKACPEFDLVLCGSQTADSETAQVGPQLAEELGIPAIGYARSMAFAEGAASPQKPCCLRVERHVDDFLELLEMDLPGLVTIDHEDEGSIYRPRYTALDGIEAAFESPRVRMVHGAELELSPGFNALKDSPTRILEVYSPTSQKENRLLKGAVKKSVDTLFQDYGKIISGAMGKDLKTHEHGEEEA
ncbi:MAG: electron transfer flavoprotein subunit beta/FixA family protein [Desulfobacterales bacterium]|nr:electron transfer flavoprotein subunit beta/FixA family protein [Desulfobacterales bacterium]